MYTFRKRKEEQDLDRIAELEGKALALGECVQMRRLADAEAMLLSIAMTAVDHKEMFTYLNTSYEGDRPLTNAVRAGDVEMVRLLLGAGCSWKQFGDVHPLVLALDSPEITEMLQRNGADPVASEVIVAASQKGLVARVEGLLAMGASARSRDVSGKSCAQCAAERGHHTLSATIARRQHREEALDLVRCQRRGGADVIRLGSALLKAVCGFIITVQE